MTRKIRLGCIGVGAIMRMRHLPNIRKLDGIELVAFCDTDPKVLSETAKEFGVDRTYSDHHDMLEKEDLDAVSVAVPPFAHTDAEIIAAEKGIHILVEKPPALTMEKAREINEAVERSGIVAAVGFQERYRASNEEVKRRLEGKTLLQALVHRVHGGVALAPWWSVEATSGGALVENGIHMVDLLRWLAGEIELVSAFNVARTVKTDKLDIPFSQCANFRFHSGAVANVTQYTGANVPGSARNQIILLCEDETMELSGDRLVSNGEVVFEEEGENAGLRLVRAFVEAVTTGDRQRVRSPYRDSLFSLGAVLATTVSNRSNGEPVNLSEFVGV